MTAVTMHRPQQRSVRLPSSVHRASSVQLPVPLPAQQARLQLTRRGRLVMLLALVVVGVGLLLAGPGLFGGSAAAGTTPSHPASRIVVVQPGQTLWAIAGQVAPGTDRRDTIARIVDLNALSGSVVSPGQRIAVPTR